MSELQFLPFLFFFFPCSSKFCLERSEELLQFSLNPQSYLPHPGSIALSIAGWQVGQEVCVGVWKEQTEQNDFLAAARLWRWQRQMEGKPIGDLRLDCRCFERDHSARMASALR
jgi:hypothetical protein